MSRAIEVKDVVNPFTVGIVASAGRSAGLQKRENEARDALCISDAELKAIEREIADSPMCESGPVVPTALSRRHGRALASRQQAEGEWQYAEEKALAARGELFKLQKASERWEAQQAHLARQAEVERALTPRERELRQFRALAEKYGR